MGLWMMHAIDSQAPASNWNSDNGQVNVNNDNVGNSDDNIGARVFAGWLLVVATDVLATAQQWMQ